MGTPRFTPEFKEEAVRQITERGYSIAEVSERLGVSAHSLYKWLRAVKPDNNGQQAQDLLYGYRRIHGDLREIGEVCSRNRVAKIMRKNRIQAIHGYKVPRGTRGRPSLIAPNRVQREFTVVKPNQVRVTDITYIRTWQGWLYLAVVIDLFARNVVGWSMKPTLSRELALDALLMAVWRRKPTENVIVHSDQGSQYGSDDWQRFCRANNLAPSMSRRGNCWDNAVAESFFSSLKKERIRKRIYKTRDMARADIFDYIEVFYNRNRRHSHLGGVSPEAFEKASP
ncbi:TPA: IS3 family transposase [Salmonella enterica subsp. enterica serovar Veneziana]|nr:IS3 family transposase [Salmonella enterica subsp. enterica serovar Veneziana]